MSCAATLRAEAQPLRRQAQRRKARGDACVGEPHIARIERYRFREALDVAICIPVRDEAERLAACLAAVEDAAIGCADDHIGVVVVVNNSVDQSAAIALDWASRARCPALVCVVELPGRTANVAHARALAFDLALEMAAPDAVLLTTDGDTRVAPEWAHHLATAVRGCGAMAAGTITADPAELACLPPQARATGKLEADLKAAYRAAWHAILPGTQCIPLISAGGANMAMSAAAYRDVGGLPTAGRNEDRAMVAAMLRAGRPVVAAPRAVAVTSCRLDARAIHGMAEALLERCHSADPRLDEVLTEFDHFLALALAYGVLSGRLAYVDPDDVAGRLSVPAAMLRRRPRADGLLSEFVTVMEAAPKGHGLTRSRGAQELQAAHQWLNEAAALHELCTWDRGEPFRSNGGRALCPM